MDIISICPALRPSYGFKENGRSCHSPQAHPSSSALVARQVQQYSSAKHEITAAASTSTPFTREHGRVSSCTPLSRKREAFAHFTNVSNDRNASLAREPGGQQTSVMILQGGLRYRIGVCQAK